MHSQTAMPNFAFSKWNPVIRPNICILCLIVWGYRITTYCLREKIQLSLHAYTISQYCSRLKILIVYCLAKVPCEDVHHFYLQQNRIIYSIINVHVNCLKICHSFFKFKSINSLFSSLRRPSYTYNY